MYSGLFPELHVGYIVAFSLCTVMAAIVLTMYIETIVYIGRHLSKWRPRDKAKWVLSLYPVRPIHVCRLFVRVTGGVSSHRLQCFNKTRHICYPRETSKFVLCYLKATASYTLLLVFFSFSLLVYTFACFLCECFICAHYQKCVCI